MFLTEKEKIDIGRLVYTQQMSKAEAAEQYKVSIQTITNYVKTYLKSMNIDAIPKVERDLQVIAPDYSQMSKDELIHELMLKDIEIARTKKGYSVKGGGKTKEFNSIKDQNT